MILFSAPLAVQIHAFSAILALLLGAFVLFRRKGTRLHKVMGRFWALLMFVTATSSWFIQDIRLIGPFSPIHGFALLTYFGLAEGIWHIRRGNVEAHRKAMVGLYFGALILAGAFTLLPGRRMSQVLFGPDANPVLSVAAIAVLLAAAILTWRQIERAPVRKARSGPV